MVLMLLTSFASALAEGDAEEIYLRQIPQSSYINTMLLPEDTYPMVCISPFASYSLYESYRKEPWFILFNLPDGAVATEFDTNSCHLVDMDNQIQYSYQATDDYSYESFLNKCENDDYIIYDGEGKKAAYIDPDSKRAYGLIGIPEITKGTKLYISISMNGINRNVATEKRIPLLADAVRKEVDRVQSQLLVKKMDRYWTDGNYAGVRMLCMEYSDLMLVLDFPEMTLQMKDGTVRSARMFLTKLDGYDMTGYCDFGDNTSLKVEISMETYSYVPYKKAEDPSQVHAVTLSDGTEIEIYMNTLSDGTASLVYSSRLLDNNAGYSRDQNYYLNINLDGENLRWRDVEDAAGDLDIIMKSIRLTDPETEPSPEARIPAGIVALLAEIPSSSGTEETVAPAATSGENAAGTWICPNCQNENSGNFCSNCGTPRPDDGHWICPNCQNENSGNFCSNCGTPKS